MDGSDCSRYFICLQLYNQAKALHVVLTIVWSRSAKLASAFLSELLSLMFIFPVLPSVFLWSCMCHNVSFLCCILSPAGIVFLRCQTLQSFASQLYLYLYYLILPVKAAEVVSAEDMTNLNIEAYFFDLTENIVTHVEMF